MTQRSDDDVLAAGLRSVLSAGGPLTSTMLWVDEDGCIARSSGALEVRLGLGKLVGRDFVAMVFHSDHGRATRLLAAAREFQCTGVLLMGADAGSAWQARVSAAPARLGDQCGVAVEITDALAPARAGGEDLDILLGLAFDGAELGVWASNPLTGELSADLRAREFHGYPPVGRIDHQAVLATLHPDDRPRFEAALHHSFEIDGPFAAEFRVVHPNGDLRWLASRGHWAVDPRDGARRMVGIVQDITRAKMAESQLRSREHFLQTLVDSLPGMVSYWTPAMRCSFANIGLRDWFSHEPRDVLGKHMSELLGPEQFGLDEPHVLEALAGRPQNFERALPKSDGTLVYTWTQYIPDAEDGEVRGVLSLVTDITAAKQAHQAMASEIANRESTEAALQLAQARFNLLADSNIVGVAIGNEHGELTLANDYYLRLLGATRADFDAGRVRWDRFTTPENRELDMQAIGELRATGVSAPYEKEYLLPDGQRTNVQIGRAQLPGNDVQMIAIVLDISVRQRANRELEQLNLALSARTQEAESANQAKSNFLSSVNHELRTPLHTMLGYAGLLLRRSDGENQRQLQIIEQSGLQLNRLIDDLLQFSVSGEVPAGLRLRPQNLRTFLARFEALGPILMRDGCNQFSLVLADDLPPRVLIDDQRLFQVLQNLLGNAFKYTSNGHVSLSVVRGPDPDPVDIPPQRCRLTFSVTDTGIGIAAEDLDRIFEAFQRGKETQGQSGLGLGLSIARHWVEAMGGDLSVDSTVGLGSRFSFEVDLPLASPSIEVEPPEPTEVASVPVGSLAATPRHVLVVDDLAINRDYLREVCRGWGYLVTEASGGVAALSICRSVVPAVEAVLVDQFMPNLDGWGLLLQMRRLPQCASIPVVLISASATQRPTGFPPDVVFDDMLGKPLDEAELQATLRRCFGEPAPRRLPVSIIEPAVAPPVPAWLPAGETANFKHLLRLGRLFAIEAWAKALPGSDAANAEFTAQVVAHCRRADLAALEALAAALPDLGNAAH